MRRKVTLVTLNFYQTSPPASGYLHTYALKDEELAANWTFEYYTRVVAKTNAEQVLNDLLDANAAVYTFSCYSWNMGMVRTVLEGLMKARPDARIILG